MSGSAYTTFIVPVFMILAGTGIIFIWAADILSGKFSDQGKAPACSLTGIMPFLFRLLRLEL